MKKILRKIYVKWLCLMGKAVDIHSKSKYPAGALSNFMPYTFVFRGMSFMSMESLLQGLKFEVVEEQNQVFRLVGVEAKRKGKGHEWHHNLTLWWQGKPMKRCSDEYRNFVEEAFRALSYNNDFQMALKATGNKRLYHTIGIFDPTKTVLTEEEFCGILTRLRSQTLDFPCIRGIDKTKNFYDVIHKGEEGEYIKEVIIPQGTQRLAPMLLDSNMLRGKGKSDSHEEYPLYQYRRIGTLVIPESLDIPHSDGQSPFASYKQRGFVWNHPTKWEKIRISSIKNNSPHLTVEDGVLYSADKTRLIYCFEEKSFFGVPSTVTTIEPYAFCLQKKLQHIELHDGITSIGDATFMACQSLTDISIPKQIKRISRNTFDGCTSLCKVFLPDGLEVIDIAAFRQCKSLKEIRLPDSLRVVRGFEGCSALCEIEIPSGVEHISDFLFCSGLRKVVLHEGVKSIDDYAFRYCDNLSEINLPDGLEYIGARAFYPSSISKLVFPATLKEIGSEAFYYNKKLYSVRFQSNVEKIDQAAFACCPLLLKAGIRKPDEMKIKDDVFIQDPGLDKFGFWD